MQLIISYDWAEGQWLAGQEGQQPTHLALRSIHVELEKRKRSKTEFFLDSASLSTSSSTNNDGPSAKERGSLNQSYQPFPPFLTSLPTSSSIILSKGVEASVKERDLLILCLPTSV